MASPASAISGGIFVSRVFWGLFMHGTLSKGAGSASKIDRPNGSATDQLVEDALAGIVWHLWGQNAPAKLAAILKCSPRTVERYLEGSREWSGDAIAAVVSEILKRHAMRNVKVAARR